MPIKIFRAIDPPRIERIEEAVNQWLAQGREGRVRQIATSIWLTFKIPCQSPDLVHSALPRGRKWRQGSPA